MLAMEETWFCWQMEKQKIKEEKDKKLMEQRAKFVEKAKKISQLEPEAEEKSRKSGSKVSVYLFCCLWS